jgi:hypothetical protein
MSIMIASTSRQIGSMSCTLILTKLLRSAPACSLEIADGSRGARLALAILWRKRDREA